MGLVLNPRGTNGAGKTELVRSVLADYRCGSEPILRANRRRPIGYRLTNPGGRTLVVLGHYETNCGGCDTVPLRDGGLDEVFRLADEHASGAGAVLLEGSMLSEEHQRTAALAGRHAVHVLCLDTPVETCVRNLMRRRHLTAAARSSVAEAVETRRRVVGDACSALRLTAANVEILGFDSALERIRALLSSGPIDGDVGEA